MRTPLSTLASQVELLESGQTLDPKSLSQLRRSVKRLTLLVEGVMRTERFSASEMPLHPKRLCLRELVRRVRDDHAEQASRKGIDLIAEAAPSLEASLDEDLCIDALSNLVDNAIKHTARGSVRLIAHESDEDSVTFEVIDSGKGIPPERQADIFDVVLSDIAGGAGLGLSIASHAVRAQGGNIAVESEAGRGSTFRIRLPKQVGHNGG